MIITIIFQNGQFKGARAHYLKIFSKFILYLVAICINIVMTLLKVIQLNELKAFELSLNMMTNNK